MPRNNNVASPSQKNLYFQGLSIYWPIGGSVSSYRKSGAGHAPGLQFNSRLQRIVLKMEFENARIAENCFLVSWNLYENAYVQYARQSVRLRTPQGTYMSTKKSWAKKFN
jgi:hypothetical protein